jgi:chromosome segregation ATPase
MTIDERLEALTHTLELQVQAQAATEQRVNAIDRRLTRAIRAGVLEARRQRKRNAALDARMDRMAEEFRDADGKLGARIDAIGARMDALVSGMGESMARAERDREAMNARMDRMAEEFRDADGKLGARIDAIGARMDALGTRIDAIGTRMETLGTRIDALVSGMGHVLAKLEQSFDRPR